MRMRPCISLVVRYRNEQRGANMCPGRPWPLQPPPARRRPCAPQLGCTGGRDHPRTSRGNFVTGMHPAGVCFISDSPAPQTNEHGLAGRLGPYENGIHVLRTYPARSAAPSAEVWLTDAVTSARRGTRSSSSP
jgi:hypothetical protein